MMISTRGRYALRVMIDLAAAPPETYTPLKEITQRHNISIKYLEAILSTLVKAGMISGIRGKGGGYRLAKAPADYTIGSILTLTEGSLAPVSCLREDNGHCENRDQCPTYPMWSTLDTMIQNYFENITLADLAAQESDHDTAAYGCPAVRPASP